MKVLDIPSSGKRGTIVAYLSPFGLCHRALIVPANTQTPARQHMRRAFGNFARAWSRVLTNDQSGLRFLLKLTGPVTADIMVFAQAPCSAGRSKRRNVSYIGLLPLAVDGLCDITALYVARYGTPRPGDKLFIVTRQQKDGWEDFDQETSERDAQGVRKQPIRHQHQILKQAMSKPPQW